MSKEHCNCNQSQISKRAQYIGNSLEIVHLLICSRYFAVHMEAASC